jgi:hypothetical protein
MRRLPGSEPAIFSRVLYQLSYLANSGRGVNLTRSMLPMELVATSLLDPARRAAVPPSTHSRGCESQAASPLAVLAPERPLRLSRDSTASARGDGLDRSCIQWCIQIQSCM